VWVPNNLFTGSHRDRPVFKGGISLSKAWKVITRFSEDVDITYDIRAVSIAARKGVAPSRGLSRRST
jgi:predicted nucleotidyltransferase component of viral defense system